MTKGRPFFDTNILIYAFTSNDPRAAVAESLLAQGGVVGVQNLNEFASVASRKIKMPWLNVQEALAAIRTFCPAPIPVTVKIHETAVELVAKHRFHIYDALVLAAAISASCSVVYTEDLQHGQGISGVMVQNPFK